MFNIRYNPRTKVYSIVENGNIIEGKFSVYKVFKMLHDYVIKMNGVYENDR